MNMNDIKERIKNIKKEQIIIFCVGLVIGLLTMVIFYPERIAKLENGGEISIKVGDTDITADVMFANLKDKYSLNSILELIDNAILDKKYEMTDEANKYVDEALESYIKTYQDSYGMTEKEFLESINMSSREEFREQLVLDYKRNKYYKDYMIDNVGEDEINNYYNEKVFGAINTEHILVKSENANAEEKAGEILDKLKNGASWEDLKNEYKNNITTESVTIKFDSSLESAYVDAAKKLSDGAYTTSLVKTSYGYHIILRVSTEEKEDQKSITDRIKNAIVSDKQSADSNLYEKVMIKMRELEGTDIKDTELKRVYENYTKKYSE